MPPVVANCSSKTGPVAASRAVPEVGDPAVGHLVDEGQHLGGARLGRRWRSTAVMVSPHTSLQVDEKPFRAAFDELLGRLRDNYPFFHPRYG
jgi:hypothetical protein